MEEPRNVTTLNGIEITSWDETESRLAVDARWAEDTSGIDACRKCGSVGASFSEHDWPQKKINDTPWRGKPVGIRLSRCRYRCDECGGTFVSRHEGIHQSRSMTTALVDYIKEKSLGADRFVTLAGRVGVSEGTIRNIARGHIQELDKKATKLTKIPKVLGVDEVHVPGTGPETGPHLVIADAEEKTVIQMREDGSSSTLREYLYDLKMRSATTDHETEVVVMDMTDRYRKAVQDRLPGAKIVVDKFHVIRKANNAVQDVRRSLMNEESDETRKAWKRKKDDLEKQPDELNSKRWRKLKNGLNGFPPLKEAYKMKNRFRNIFRLEDRSEASKAFDGWKESLPGNLSDNFEDVTKPLSNWRNEILNYFDVQYTNGCVEGLNRAISQISTEGAGYNFETLRGKVLYGLERRKATHSNNSVEFESIHRRGQAKKVDCGVPFEVIAEELELE
jgi:transposase